MNSLKYTKQKFPKLNILAFMLKLDQDYIDENCNGCGDKFTAWIVPENVFGLNIKQCCDVHDLEYQQISNIYNSYIKDGRFNKKQRVAEARNRKMRADLRFKMNIEIMADYKFEENKDDTFAFFFWKSEKWQALMRKRSHYKVAKLCYNSVELLGWGAIESNFKK